MILDEALSECPVVAIVRGVTPGEVVAIGEALFAAGVRAMEAPLNSPEPIESINRLAKAFSDRMAIGAGTVLRPEKVRQVAAAGARFIVSPNVNMSVIGRAMSLGLDAAPGFGTASEAFQAAEAGARHLKLFPAVTYGPTHVKQLRAVLPPEVVVWAVGGVGAGDFAAWWSAGARVFGLGSELYKPGQSPEETFDKAKAVVAAARALAA
ncbi:2-dehydro-3-deoxy-6-phosphogalactonate aldolase [soil metagenome]